MASVDIDINPLGDGEIKAGIIRKIADDSCLSVISN